MSKAHVDVAEVRFRTVRSEDVSVSLLLNPADLPPEMKPGVFDLINVPPTPLIKNAVLSGEFYHLGEDTYLPVGMRFGIGKLSDRARAPASAGAPFGRPLMITICLEQGQEKKTDTSPFPSSQYPPLYHQVRTLEEMSRARSGDEHLQHRHREDDCQLAIPVRSERQGQECVFIAPTNALLAQHAEDIQGFVSRNGLDFKVQQVTASEIRQSQAGCVPAKHYSG